ncbi:MAG: hypothetical protein H0V29_05080 [Thermoleophilaceae bacterium]|nr:hypothetical protein [Thermoleophilaceae bacterium]
MTRVRDCSAQVIDGRQKKAEAFLDSAEVDADMSPDVRVTLLIHAGIAASDVLCCRSLGHYVQGESHNEAIKELEKVNRKLARDLGLLLGMKTRAGYGHSPVSGADAKRAARAATRLVEATR